MAVLLSIATLVLVFAAYGYDIDRQTGGIIQNGLVILDAHPESARIHINGEDKGTTSSRLILPAGDYDIELSRPGYTSWKRSIGLEGSTIEQLVYPFLYPEKLIRKELQSYDSAPQLASSSPDRKWLVVSVPQTPGSFQVMDLGDEEHPITVVNLPVDAMTQAAGNHIFEAVEWSTDNNHLLLKHSFQEGTEFIVLNRDEPEQSLNLNKIFAGQAFTSISLRDKKADQFYMHNATDGTLYTADSRTQRVAPLVQGVHSYKSYEADTVLYIKEPVGATTVEVHVLQREQNYLVRTLPKAPNYLLEMAKFDGDFYLVAGSTADSRTYVYKNPFDDLRAKPARVSHPNRVLVTKDAQYVSFSAIARFIAVQGGSSFAVYDAETDRQYRYDTKLELAPGQKATWMDGHRMVINSKNSVHVFDFDGMNARQLAAALPGFTPFFDRDYTAMFIVSAADDNSTKAVLNRIELKVLPEDQ